MGLAVTHACAQVRVETKRLRIAFMRPVPKTRRCVFLHWCVCECVGDCSGVFGSVRECSGVFGSVRECSWVWPHT